MTNLRCLEILLCSIPLMTAIDVLPCSGEDTERGSITSITSISMSQHTNRQRIQHETFDREMIAAERGSMTSISMSSEKSFAPEENRVATEIPGGITTPVTMVGSIHPRSVNPSSHDLHPVSGFEIYGTNVVVGIDDDNRLHNGDIGDDGENMETEHREMVLYTPQDVVDESEEEELSDSGVVIGDDVDLSGSLVGVKRKYLAELYDLYRRHGCVIGFSVRKSTARWRNFGGEYKLNEKYFVCSCEGKADGRQRPTEKNDVNSTQQRRKRTVPKTRTGCGAPMRVQLMMDDMYEVVSHVMQHNHELTRTEWQHHHRSERSISESKAESIQLMTKSAMKTSTQYNYMVEGFGGVEYVGHTKKDHYNFVHKLKVKQIEGGDAQNLFNMLQKESDEDSDFYFRVKLDDKGRLCNVFWNDSMMREDYKIYGDLVVFDTTYRTNRYNLICGAIVGVNNHWKNVMFGCAFISDERIESFEWLFGVFKESMGGVAPVTIFTDQDHAMSNALAKVFPETRHRLCLWHIHKNAVSHYGKLKSDTKFKNEFNKCLRGCFSIEEFEEEWGEMIRSHDLQDDPWFQRLYSLKELWCTALNRDFFSAGILSSQRSESTNSALGFQANKTTSLSEFYSIYNATVKRWRQNEQKDEFDCSRSTPSSDLQMAPLLKHASEVYTISLFKLFEKEFAAAIATSIEPFSTDRMSCIQYKVYPYAHPNQAHIVTYCSNDGGLSISCSCRNFEVAGWLCFHIIRVLHVHSVNTIPDQYILRRWTKFAKCDVWDKMEGRSECALRLKKDAVPWRYMMTRSYYNVVSRCYKNPEAKKLIENSYTNLLASVEDLFAKVQVEDGDDSQRSDIIPRSSDILDPPHANTKGRRARKKGALERGKRKRGSSDAGTTNDGTIRLLNSRLL